MHASKIVVVGAVTAATFRCLPLGYLCPVVRKKGKYLLVGYVVSLLNTQDADATGTRRRAGARGRDGGSCSSSPFAGPRVSAKPIEQGAEASVSKAGGVPGAAAMTVVAAVSTAALWDIYSDVYLFRRISIPTAAFSSPGHNHVTPWSHRKSPPTRADRSKMLCSVTA